MRGPFWSSRMSATNTVSGRIGTNCGASTGHTAGFWHRSNSVAHFSVTSRGDWEARDPAVAQELFAPHESTCAPGLEPHRVMTWWMVDSELACPFHAHRQVNGMGKLLDRELRTSWWMPVSERRCTQCIQKVARASGSSKFAFRAAGALGAEFFESCMESSTMNFNFTRHWRNRNALLAKSERNVVNGIREDERQLLLQRLVLLGAEATTSAQRPRLRMSNNNMCQVSKDFVVKMLRPGYIVSVVTGTFSRAYSHALVDTNVNMMQTTFKPFFCVSFGANQRLFVTSPVPLPDRPTKLSTCIF